MQFASAGSHCDLLSAKSLMDLTGNKLLEDDMDRRILDGNKRIEQHLFHTGIVTKFYNIGL